VDYLKYLCVLLFLAQFMEFDLDNSGDIGMTRHFRSLWLCSHVNIPVNSYNNEKLSML